MTGFISGKEYCSFPTYAVTLITRPRRFGKTLNLSMMECFFSTVSYGRTELFEGLKIW